MTRIAYAARTLLDQVGGDPVGDSDGFGVRRTVMVPAAHADALAQDPRVSGVAVVNTALGQVALVRFVSGRMGDLTGPFILDP